VVDIQVKLYDEDRRLIDAGITEDSGAYTDRITVGQLNYNFWIFGGAALVVTGGAIIAGITALDTLRVNGDIETVNVKMNGDLSVMGDGKCVFSSDLEVNGELTYKSQTLDERFMPIVGGQLDSAVEGVRCRYIRFERLDDAMNHVRFTKLNVYTPSGSKYSTANWTGSVSGLHIDGQNTIASLLDGNLATYVLTNFGRNGWVEVDMLEMRDVVHFEVINMDDPIRYSRAISIQVKLYDANRNLIEANITEDSGAYTDRITVGQSNYNFRLVGTTPLSINMVDYKLSELTRRVVDLESRAGYIWTSPITSTI
jgi:hypothetical protein